MSDYEVCNVGSNSKTLENNLEIEEIYSREAVDLARYCKYFKTNFVVFLAPNELVTVSV